MNADSNNQQTDGVTTQDAAHQYLTFKLADQDYGVEILQVQEIRGWERPTRIPHSSDCVLGVVNLRGAVVPIIDLRRRFGLEETTYGPSTVVVVVRVASGQRLLTAGLVVDTVSEVCSLQAESRRQLPEFGGVDASLIDGLAMHNGRILVLIGVTRLVTGALADPSLTTVAA